MTGAAGPQSSFDTGHFLLGTLFAKGIMALNSCKYASLFCVRPCTLLPDAATPRLCTGVVYPEHIEMAPMQPNQDALLRAHVTGNCQVVVPAQSSEAAPGYGSMGGLKDSMMMAGGCPILLYLAWACTAGAIAFCGENMGHRGKKGKKAPSVPVLNLPFQPNVVSDSIMNRLTTTVQLLAAMVRSSAEFKEQLVQLHGFHVLGSCLADLPVQWKRHYLGRHIIGACMDLVNSLGPMTDAVKVIN